MAARERVDMMTAVIKEGRFSISIIKHGSDAYDND